jgi:hypothetical protein
MSREGRPGRALRPALAISLILIAAASTGVAVARFGGRAHRYSFGLWGDMPYAKAGDGPKIPALIAGMNHDRLAFTAFDGDIKDGVSPCTDDRYTTAIDRFDTIEAPTVYVPGDNEWTDCHRTNNGGYDNLERLAHLRRVMFARPDSFGVHPMPLVHQGKAGEAYSENTRWAVGDAVFVGLNVPGSNNNKVNGPDCANKSVRTPADCAADNAEYAARNAANIEFLRSTFALAKSGGSLGVVVVMQADPSFDMPETEDVNERTCVRAPQGQCLPAPADPARGGYDGYNSFLAALIEESTGFSGHVLLVHGDTHFFKLDQPLVDQAHLLPNLTRLQTFGSPNINWVQVTVEPKDRALFTVQPMIVQ